LFYFAPDGALMGVQIRANPTTWTASSPQKLLEPRYFTGNGNLGRQYDVARDGRFLMIKDQGNDSTRAAPDLVVVRHWDEELKRRVPDK
jgi:hypothetical protein